MLLGTIAATSTVMGVEFALRLGWEATSVFSFLLIGFEADSPSARRSAPMALHATAADGLRLLAAILLIGVTAQFHFHFWLPNAMQAPTPASAYRHSATM